MSAQPEWPASISLRSTPVAAVTDTAIERPPHLSPRGIIAWDTYAPPAKLTAPDIPAFTAYVEAIAVLEETCELIAEFGIVTIDQASGIPIASPLLAIRDRAANTIQTYGRLYGAR